MRPKLHTSPNQLTYTGPKANLQQLKLHQYLPKLKPTPNQIGPKAEPKLKKVEPQLNNSQTESNKI